MQLENELNESFWNARWESNQTGRNIGECYNSIQPRANTEVFINLMKK